MKNVPAAILLSMMVGLLVGGGAIWIVKDKQVKTMRNEAASQEQASDSEATENQASRPGEPWATGGGERIDPRDNNPVGPQDSGSDQGISSGGSQEEKAIALAKLVVVCALANDSAGVDELCAQELQLQSIQGNVPNISADLRSQISCGPAFDMRNCTISSATIAGLKQSAMSRVHMQFDRGPANPLKILPEYWIEIYNGKLKTDPAEAHKLLQEHKQSTEEYGRSVGLDLVLTWDSDANDWRLSQYRTTR